MLNQPLEFQLEELVSQFGYLEIVHQLGQLMDKNSKYRDLVGDLEKVRDKIIEINEQ